MCNHLAQWRCGLCFQVVCHRSPLLGGTLPLGWLNWQLLFQTLHHPSNPFLGVQWWHLKVLLDPLVDLPLNMIIGGSISPFAVQESTAVRSPFSAPVVLTCTAFLPLTSTVRPGTISKEDWQSVVNVSSVPNWVHLNCSWMVPPWIQDLLEVSEPWMYMYMLAWQDYGAS